jgi:predicted RNase H-like HicB family nuclease
MGRAIEGETRRVTQSRDCVTLLPEGVVCLKTFDVIVEQRNGSYRALMPALPNILAEGATRDEAIANVKTTAQQYLANVEVATVELAERPIEAAALISFTLTNVA